MSLSPRSIHLTAGAGGGGVSDDHKINSELYIACLVVNAKQKITSGQGQEEGGMCVRACVRT